MTAPTDSLTWKTPAGRQQAGAAASIADALRAKQGDWAIIEEHEVPVYPANATEEEKEVVRAESKKVRAKASSRASLIKQGRVAAFKSKIGTAGAFNAVSRSEVSDDGVKVIRVYAVYLGEDHAKPVEEAEAE
jgi:hypothetical protein